MSRLRLTGLGLAAVLFGTPAAAHHRQTPAVLTLTTSGDATLPRVAPPGRITLALALPPPASDTPIVSMKPYKTPLLVTPLSTSGDNRNPAVSLSGNVVAWDTDADPAGTGNPGRQVVLSRSGFIIAGPSDPTGTSANPTLDTSGLRAAFESTGDLASTGNAGAQQVFLLQPTGGVSQVSIGVGTSRNPVLAARKGRLAFESTSKPGTGEDTGIEQIWLGSVDGGSAAPITDGVGPSTKPAFSNDGAILAFQSRADLAGDEHDTGIDQIFVYDIKSRTYARVTQDAGGCTDPAVAKVKRDWRVAYVCGGQAYFYMLRADQLFHVQAAGGDTTRLLPALAVHFVLLATTADLAAGSGTTAGHRVYMVNLFKRPAEMISGPAAVWFPFRGVGPL